MNEDIYIIKLYTENLPYEFEIQDFRFNIFSNSYSGNIYIIGYDLDGNLLGNGAEKLVLDYPLWWIYQLDKNGNRDKRYPKFDLIPRSVDGKEYPITRENLNTKIILEYRE